MVNASKAVLIPDSNPAPKNPRGLAPLDLQGIEVLVCACLPKQATPCVAQTGGWLPPYTDMER